jgi:hypothetical protein
MLRPSLHERRFVDQVFARINCKPGAKVESESILHLMFQVQFTELCTIIPSHFKHMPGLHREPAPLICSIPSSARRLACSGQRRDDDANGPRPGWSRQGLNKSGGLKPIWASRRRQKPSRRPEMIGQRWASPEGIAQTRTCGQLTASLLT